MSFTRMTAWQDVNESGDQDLRQKVDGMTWEEMRAFAEWLTDGRVFEQQGCRPGHRYAVGSRGCCSVHLVESPF